MNHFFSASFCNSRSWMFVFAVTLLTSITSQSWAAPNDGFTTDMDAAVEQAKEQNKDLMLFFTGSDWCPPCQAMVEEVFSKQEFLDGVSKDFVLVELDFPKKELEPELKKQNDSLKAKFAVSAYPTIIMVDKDLKPFAFSGGYSSGGPENFIKLMTDARQLRVQRDENLTAAQEKTGAERAKLLDAAINGFDGEIASIYYPDVVEEIVELDNDNSLGLRGKWNADADAETRKVILADLLVRSRLAKPEQTMQFIDEVLNQIDFNDLERLSILQIKFNLARETNDLTAATSVLDEMIALDGVTSGTRQRLIAKKAYVTYEAASPQAAMDLLNKQIAAVKNPASSDVGYLYLAKGELQSKTGNAADALETLEAGIAATPNNHDLLIELVAAKSDCLFNSGQQTEARRTLDDFADDEAMPADLRADALLQMSMLLREANENRQARLIENKAIKIVESPAEKAAIQKMVERMRAKFD